MTQKPRFIPQLYMFTSGTVVEEVREAILKPPTEEDAHVCPLREIDRYSR